MICMNMYLARVNVNQAKEEFILAWGKLGTQWGVSRTMAQVHALLLLSTDLMSTEDIWMTGITGISRQVMNG